MYNIKKINFLLGILLIVVVSGCSIDTPKYLSTTYNKNFKKQNKAIIIIKIIKPYNDLFQNKRELEATFELVRLNKNHENKNKQECYLIKATKNDNALVDRTYSSEIITIKPGLYYINNISWTDEVYKYKFELPGIFAKNTILYGAFEVKPGDVSYVGTLIIKGNTSFLTKTSELAKVKSDLLKNQYNDLSEEVKETKFYGQFSKLHKDNNDNFTLQQFTWDR